jgi:TRAP-type C4-dicarboxylate transport system substrate-binding protein
MLKAFNIFQCKKGRRDRRSFFTRKEEVSVMKKACLASMVALMVLVLVGWVTVKAQAQTIKLTYSCFFPDGHTQAKLARAWSKEVEDRTKGRVKIQFFPGGSLTKPPQCYDGVISKASDLGLSVLGFTPGRFPVVDTVGLPLGYTSGRIATGLSNEVYRHFKPKEFNDTEVMYFFAHGPGFTHTKGKPVRKLEDMKNFKFRVQANTELIVKQLGGKYRHGTINDAYGMFKRGEVDGSLHPLEANYGFKMGEVVNYITAAYPIAYTAVQFVVMNKDRWNALPEGIKKIIREINNEWIPQHGEAWDTIDAEGMRYFLDNGGQIIGLDRNEAARWKMAVAPIIDDYAKILSEKGLNGQEIVDFTIKTLNSMQ